MADPVATLIDAAAHDRALDAVLRAWCASGRISITAGRLGRAIRDRHLRQAFQMVGGVAELFHAARRFESVVWPRWRHLPAPPDTASALHRLLFQARQGAEFPDSVRQFERIARQIRSD